MGITWDSGGPQKSQVGGHLGREQGDQRMRGGEVQEEEVRRLGAQATRGTRIQAEGLGFPPLIPFSASFIMDPAASRVPSTHSVLMLGLGRRRQTHTSFRTIVSGQCYHSCPLHLGLRADFMPSTGQNPSCALSPRLGGWLEANLASSSLRWEGLCFHSPAKICPSPASITSLSHRGAR